MLILPFSVLQILNSEYNKKEIKNLYKNFNKMSKNIKQFNNKSIKYFKLNHFQQSWQK